MDSAIMHYGPSCIIGLGLLAIAIVLSDIAPAIITLAEAIIKLAQKGGR